MGVGGDSPCSAPGRGAAAQTGEVARELGRGEQLGLRRHKAGPVGPSGLHGGCTEAGLIRGTRPSELITGPGFPALPATIPPGRGAETLAAAGRGRVAPGGARACLGPGFLAWGLHLLSEWRSSERWGMVHVLPFLPSPSPAVPGEATESFICPPKAGSWAAMGAREASVCVCASVVCACAAGSTSRL